jgi:site-specific DNA recombinase
MANPSKKRCAIYTRKSTEDGLEQAFNSLDAQREACAAYITSQRHEGWTLVPDLYDDGGFSGGSMERPGLKRLLADIEAGRVDVIVVYKVDRLTRSLADFAKIVDVLDARGASFVSITQAFNTTTSMGRLTLNVLLSFAQFEREVTGERIRDKIAASKKKGIWMGGPMPLGSDVRDRKLVVNETEAETVRLLMQRYLDHGSVRALLATLAGEGVRTKVQVLTSGPHRGGIAFGRGSLLHLLKNRIYRGEIVHKATAYPGEHPAIVPEDLWDAVQARIAGSGPGVIKKVRARHPSLLLGLILDGHGRRMSPTHANRGSKRYRYYVTHADGDIDPARPAWRVPAHDLERIVVERLSTFLADGHAVIEAAGAAAHQASEAQRILAAASATAVALTKSSSWDQQTLLRRLIERVALQEDSIDIVVRTSALCNEIEADQPTTQTVLTARIARVRRGHEIRLVIQASDAVEHKPKPRNERLAMLLAEAFAAREMVSAAPEQSIEQIATRNGTCRKRLTKLVKLSWLAPDLVRQMLDGRELSGLTPQRLLDTDLPTRWADQRIMLGTSAHA